MKLLCLDLSTSCTGYALFEDGKLKRYGIIKPKVKGISSLKYPEGAYHRIIDVSDRVRDLVAEIGPDEILIEEINRGINRIGQKSLDALHFFVIDRLFVLDPLEVKKIKYKDSNGKKGWRGDLGLKLDNQDKLYNKEAREFNKKNKTAIKNGDKEELPIIDWKDLSIRYCNKTYKMDLKVDNSGDADIADAVAMGSAFLKSKESKRKK